MLNIYQQQQHISFSIYSSLIEIKIDFYKKDKKDKYKFLLVNTPNRQLITNIKYVITNDCFLYFTSKDTMKRPNWCEYSINKDKSLLIRLAS